jgi:hypothetical protein
MAAKLPAIPAKNGENGFLYEPLRENKFPLAAKLHTLCQK